LAVICHPTGGINFNTALCPHTFYDATVYNTIAHNGDITKMPCTRN